MKLISWNVNGLRAVFKKGFEDFLATTAPDFLCIQETKMQEGQLDLSHLAYDVYMNSAVKKGYSGTAIFTKHKPITVTYGLGIEAHDQEGRVITLEYDDFYLVNVYTPNAQRTLARLDYRMEWEDDFTAYLATLDAIKPVIMCGDLNVAHTEIDLANPKTNLKNAGFTPEERGRFTTLLDTGFTDSFRHLYPDTTGAYTWWSYMNKARDRNIGWRIDYFIVSDRLQNNLKDATIFPEVLGSDHCPIGIKIAF